MSMKDGLKCWDALVKFISLNSIALKQDEKKSEMEVHNWN